LWLRRPAAALWFVCAVQRGCLNALVVPRVCGRQKVTSQVQADKGERNFARSGKPGIPLFWGVGQNDPTWVIMTQRGTDTMGQNDPTRVISPQPGTSVVRLDGSPNPKCKVLALWFSLLYRETRSLSGFIKMSYDAALLRLRFWHTSTHLDIF